MSLQTTGQQTSPKTWAIIIWGLYLASFVTVFLTMVVGVIIAYVKRRDLVGTPFESHMTSAIRTFWISVIGSIIGYMLTLVLIGFVMIFFVVVWLLFRSIRGLIRALDGRPIDNPRGWF
jgi:uncharacterized membrane protein